ncbi:MAG TPA: lysyl oxidase family protein [Acidimicrobiales bacterium]|nr:lysyl oxidase family protein [Acidimicrobiales bacterium]
MGSVVVLIPWYPAQSAAPVPPSCDPTTPTVGAEACIGVLTGDPGDPFAPQRTYPDLSPNVTEVEAYPPVLGYDEATQTFTYGPNDLYFDTHARNLGSVPLDLVADDPSNVNGSSVSQCVSWTTNLGCRERVTVGGFVWHDIHTHFHFEDFASYELRRLRRNGTVDYRQRGLIATSEKVSFCLLDSIRIRDDSSPVLRYTSCTHAQEGISPGWADIYGSNLEGQSVSLAGVSDGRYALVINMNPGGHVLETDATNNRVVAIVEMTNLATPEPTVSIVDRFWN